MTDEHDAFEEKMEAELRATRAEIDKLKHEGDSAKADDQLDVQNHIESLKKQCEDFQARLCELGEASDESSEEVKTGFLYAWKEFKGFFERTKSNIEKKVV